MLCPPRELVRYGFDEVGLDRIIAQTLSVNTASPAVMERVGLTYVRTFPTYMTAPVEGIAVRRRTNRGHLLAQRSHECDVHA
jgi:RimJ/RimL family protein N-acetyltransferase